MPMTTKQIPHFETQKNISINVYILEYKCRKNFSVNPTYLTKDTKKALVNFLLLQAEGEDAAISRFH